MNLALDSQQVEALRNCYEQMRHAYPTHQIAWAPVLVPAGDGEGEPWIEGVYEVHWPMYDPEGVAGFIWVSPDGNVVTVDASPEAGAYMP
jgi:hypothetical protein